MKIYFGCDHGGFKMKGELLNWLKKEGHEVEDMGAHELDGSDDFVDYALDVVDCLLQEMDGRGILLCRNGVGVSIVANRFAGVRCALGFDKDQVEKARTDDDVNCLALPADYIDIEQARGMIAAFLETEFSNESKYQRRVAKLEMIGGVESCGDGCCGGGCGDGGC